MKHANIGNQNALKNEDDKATSKLICRVNPKIKAQWVRSAQKEGKKLTEWVTDVLNEKASA